MTQTPGAGGAYRVRKAINNSVVLAHDAHGRDYVFLGRGIGFGRRPGDAVDLDHVDRRFAASDPHTGIQVGAYLSSIPPEDIALAARVVEQAGAVLGPAIGEREILPLADHLSVAIHHAQEGTALSYPLRWEIESIYPREVQFARTVLEYIDRERGVTLPDGEALSIGLHFVNAQLGSGEMARTMEITRLITDSLGLLSSRLETPVDPDSVEVARFVTHLRFLIVRKLEDEQVAPIDPSVRLALEQANREAIAVADDVVGLLADHFGWTVTEDEVVYIALHAASVLHAGAPASAHRSLQEGTP